jgi:hypothetical protein
MCRAASWWCEFRKAILAPSNTREFSVVKRKISFFWDNHRNFLTHMAQYAQRLKKGAWRGDCGVDETQDSWSELSAKIDELVELIRESDHVVVHTGLFAVLFFGVSDKNF